MPGLIVKIAFISRHSAVVIQCLSGVNLAANIQLWKWSNVAKQQLAAQVVLAFAIRILNIHQRCFPLHIPPNQMINIPPGIGLEMYLFW